MYSTLTKERQQSKILGKKETQFKSQDLPLFHCGKENVSNVTELLVHPKSKALEQLLYEKAHYRKNYYVANARGKRVLRFQFRKLESQISKLST